MVKPPYHYDRLLNVPPRMAASEVAAFINYSMQHANPEHIRRQKEIEEQSVERFRFPEQEGGRSETTDHRQ